MTANHIPERRGFVFDRPLVLLQSDDWGRVGVRDREGFEQLRAARILLGERPYDFYTLETAEDVTCLSDLLKRHRDSSGRAACLEMNFILANVDFCRTLEENHGTIHLKTLKEGLPGKWTRPGLWEAYSKGVADGVFYPGLHGLTHFCLSAVDRHLSRQTSRGLLLRTFWAAETPFIHWRMPWIGYEYWDPEHRPDERFLSAETQQQAIRETVETFTALFSLSPFSACAPGYRADERTHRAWADNGIRVGQNGSGRALPPYLDHHGLLQVFRSVDFEPAVDPAFSCENCLGIAERCFSGGIPLVISVHSINFHSSLKDFRTGTLRCLHQFLTALRAGYPDLLFVHDADLWDIVNRGKYEHAGGTIRVGVKQTGPARRWLTVGRGA